MAEKSKLFDYNTSFLVTRTNPLLTGNVKLTVDSSGGVFLNSINANEALSTSRFKNYKVSGKNTYATDLYQFLDNGNVKSEILFDVAKKTDGETKSSDSLALQYDFFYGSGAKTLVDNNYSEPFSYFAPLWLKNELPEFFVIFKTPNPLSYSYSTNVEPGGILTNSRYKVIQNPDSSETFSISYGKDSLGNPILYKAGEFFEGDEIAGGLYYIKSGTGKVTLMEELKFQSSVDNIEELFNNKILNNSSVVETFDLRQGTVIGDYIRSIVNNPAFPSGPIDFNFGDNSYTYYHGVDYKDGIYSKSGELLHDYLVSSESTPMIDFESYVTGGFARNGIISTNIINLEFAFGDSDSDLYTINRYFGMYVSRNDMGKLKMNGSLYSSENSSDGNNNLPKPKRDNVGYYYNNTPYKVESSTGIRLYYEGATGWIPGSDDTNINDANKLYYLTDKNDKFYSLKRTENYVTANSEDTYGSYINETFDTKGTLGYSEGNLVIANKKSDLHDFTGIDNFLASLPVIKSSEKGSAYSDIQFNKIYDLPRSIVFKLFWSGGIYSEHGRNYDLIYSGDYSGIMPWIKGSFYNFGGSKVFNPYDGTTSDIANSFASLVRDFAGHRLDTGNVFNTSILRSNITGSKPNKDFSISVFYDYDNFESKYRGLFDDEIIYAEGDIVMDPNDNYLEYVSGDWNPYKTFSSGSGYGTIKGVDFSEITSNVSFTGGTDYITGRIAFSKTNSNIIKVGNYVQTDKGYTKISSIDRLVDYPIKNNLGEVNGFKNFDLLLVANLEDNTAIIKTGSDSRMSVFESHELYTGVFTFFDIKDFDFDFWSSEYSKTPIAEAKRYYYLLAEQPGNIMDGIPYYVKSGSIKYNGIVYNEGSVFEGDSPEDSFIDLRKSGISAVVVPGPFSQMKYTGPGSYSNEINYEDNLDSFNGFYGIEAIDDGGVNFNSDNKESLFTFGKLNTEYEYLQENYNISTSNISRVVPYINKWSMVRGTDGRGNPYRLNSSPAFSPTNFSPSIDREVADPAYLTHEGFILESLPRDYPISEVNKQNSYLPSSPDYDKIRSADPTLSSYFALTFTVSSDDYPGVYQNESGLTKEFFGAFSFNEASGFYEVVFRGVKYVLKRRSNIGGISDNDPRSFIPNYRGFDGYKFTSILRVIPEDDSIQSPVKYEIIENAQQKSVVFLITVVIDDYRAKQLSVSPDDSSVVDYTLLYTLSDKKDLCMQTNGLELSCIGDTKLSVGLDLSYSSGSFVDDIISPGRIYAINNEEYDTDLREEIKLTFPEGSNKTSTSVGSFSVPANSSTYPWPTGVAKDFLEFGKLTNDYSFNIPFLGGTGGITIPVGSSNIYKGKPVYQVEGGGEYFDSITSRISMGQIAKRINLGDPYIKYTTYKWNPDTLSTEESGDQLVLRIESPSYYQKPTGPYPQPNLSGPQIIGESQITSYEIVDTATLKTDLLRFGGFYEPIARKVIMFRNDKNDTIYGDPSQDLSFRNATFGPNRDGFGLIKNLNYTKVSLDQNILSASSKLPEGAVYPLVNETPIARKGFSLFYSTWDPGYYDIYTTSKDKLSVAGTRSMLEHKSFFGSKMMKTPDSIRIDNFIGMEVSKTDGNTDINGINTLTRKYVRDIQNMTQKQNADGTGQIPKVFIGVDIEKMEEDIFPDVEIFWQNTIDPFKNDSILGVKGVIRMDRMLKRYLLNSGVEKSFIDNIVSEFGTGDPTSIEDDILEYLELNVIPIFESGGISFYKKSLGEEFQESELTVRGDIIPSYRSRTGYINDANFSLTKRTDLVFEFDYKLNPAQFNSMNFSFIINKI